MTAKKKTTGRGEDWFDPNKGGAHQVAGRDVKDTSTTTAARTQGDQPKP